MDSSPAPVPLLKQQHIGQWRVEPTLPSPCHQGQISLNTALGSRQDMCKAFGTTQPLAISGSLTNSWGYLQWYIKQVSTDQEKNEITSHILSDLNGVKLDISNNRNNRKHRSSKALYSLKKCLKIEKKKQVKVLQELNENERTEYPYLWDAMKAVLRESSWFQVLTQKRKYLIKSNNNNNIPLSYRTTKNMHSQE